MATQAVEVTKQKSDMEKISERNADKSNWEHIEIPATDLFGKVHSGVSINFEKFEPEKDDSGQYTGNPGKYFVSPEKASEIRRLLDMRLRSDMRVLQPQQDQAMLSAMRKAGKGAPDLRG